MSGEMKFLDFPHSEYKARIEKARENMHEKKLDVLLLTEKANLIYFSGYRTVLYISKFRPFICVLPRDRDPVMVVPDLEEALCRKTSWIDDVRAWGSTAKIANPITLTKETLSELNLERGRIGMEFGLGCRLGMTWIEFERLRNEMPEAEFVNCSDLIWRVRSVKSEEEIRRIEKACEITDKAVEAAWSILHEGVTETELDRAIKRTIVEEGGDGLAFGVVRSGRHRLDMLNAYPSDYKIQTGDL
ncbi:MAG: M24 family metallopeptidase, partial [Candidatus Bathyarchaeia archaeon]